MLGNLEGARPPTHVTGVHLTANARASSGFWAGALEYQWPTALLLICGLFGMANSRALVTAATLALCVWALRGPYWALQSLALATIIKFLNPDLVAFPPGFGALSWLVVLVAVLRLAPTLRAAKLTLLGPILLFSGFALLTALVSSRAPIVSIMKALSFAALVSTTLAATADLRTEQLTQLLKWLLTVASTVVFLSMVTLLRPAIAYEINTRLLHGIINQPQSLGVIAAPMAAALLTRYFLDRRGLTVLHIAFTAALWTGMLLTQARTAAIAAIGGAAIATLASQWSRNHSGREPYIRRMIVAIVLLGITVTVIELQTGKIAPAVQAFILKRGAPDGVKDAFLASRGLGALSEFQNFLDSPVIGNGFGVYPNGEFPAGVVTVAGVPLSAPVEKGFLPTAVLEETGLLGTAILSWALYVVLRLAWKSSSLPLIGASFACVLVNIGEANLLSPAGLGYYLWLIIGLAVRSGQLDSLESTATCAGSDSVASDARSPSLPNLMT
jgi:hypothetical protein